ncbi:hypothetical protein KGF56_000402 [Candida oxycetoniae]|uniref:Uncharacterized protein n=1 Tax=Candida oxycetoniae TaxID=497107 RepID=A0AAI9T1N0_9ASCO|nr:uncharacterized protein KGF56_000402 [Candida oxycetoniae]KAI3406797.2 hypothetical protein KGF56_000402 [Candida oxycetoniae]
MGSLSLQGLPLELLQNIFNHQLEQISSDPINHQSSLIALASTSRLLNSIVNIKLYSDITIYDDDNYSIVEKGQNRTFIHIKKLAKFVEYLTIGNFHKINSIHIHCKSNFNKFEYIGLYSKLSYFWSKYHHCIEFINFDIDNIRKNQTLLQYLSTNCYQVVEENDEVEAAYQLQESFGFEFDKVVNRVVNLSNWSILNVEELSTLPLTNPNLKTLDFFIEAGFVNETLPGNLLQQQLVLSNLQSLNLNTTLSTQYFLMLNLKMPNLSKLSISYSHTFNRPAINFDDYHMINFDKLTDLELKFNCLHSDCTCINGFYHALSTHCIPPSSSSSSSSSQHNYTKLKNLSIINYNSKNQVSNLQQYTFLMSNQLDSLFLKFPNIRYLYLNVNEFIKNDQCKINWLKFTKSIQLLENLRSLTIADFFKWWIPTIQSTRNSLVNTCSCFKCHSIKQTFQQMASYDEKNNYTHNFTNFVPEDIEYGPSIDLVKKCNSKFLSYLFTRYQSQFYQSIIYSMSTFYYRKQCSGNNDVFTQFQELLRHNQLNLFASKLKGKNNKLIVNLGGVLV